MEQEILDYLKGKGWLSTTEIATALSEDKTQIRLMLKSLVENRKISKRGKKRGTKYGLMMSETGTDLEPSEVVVDVENFVIANNFSNIFEMIEAAMTMISHGEMYSVTELAQEICSLVPSSRFAIWDVLKALPVCAKKGIVSAWMAKTPEGNRAMYSRP